MLKSGDYLLNKYVIIQMNNNKQKNIKDKAKDIFTDVKDVGKYLVKKIWKMGN